MLRSKQHRTPCWNISPITWHKSRKGWSKRKHERKGGGERKRRKRELIEKGRQTEGEEDNEDEPDVDDEVEEPKKKTKYDQRHPPCPRLQGLFGCRYLLVHLGAWLPSGHPYDNPVVSGDYIRTATSFSRAYRLTHALEHLTTELSKVLCAFNYRVWEFSRDMVAALHHFFPETKVCSAGDFECWAHRAVLFNQETRAHRDSRDAKFGYAVIVAFGSFTGGLCIEMKLYQEVGTSVDVSAGKVYQGFPGTHFDE